MATLFQNAQYPCEFCPVRMARLHDINRHIRLHSKRQHLFLLTRAQVVTCLANEKPYECLGCGETFRRSDARVRHWLKSKGCSEVHKEKSPAHTQVSRELVLTKHAYDPR